MPQRQMVAHSQVLSGLKGREHSFKLLNEGAPSGRNRAAFPRRRSARMAAEAYAWLTTGLENWKSTVGNPETVMVQVQERLSHVGSGNGM